MAPRVAGREAAGHVDANTVAGATFVPRNGQLDLSGCAIGQLVEPCCGGMAKNRARRTGEKCGGFQREWRRRRIAHEVHTTVKPVKAASGDSMGDRGFAETQIDELAMRDHTVLSRGQPADQQINRPNVHLDQASDEVSGPGSP